MQKQQIGEQRGSMEEQQQQLQQQQQWGVLKCPRCESSNTKFCYYNNYSLSQPRHFCKACKRYWTRGGTLRNVPVGGGCRRKNKRAKRHSIDGASSSASSSVSVATNPHPPAQPRIMDMPSSSTYSPLFYGMPANPSEMNNLRFPPPTRFSLTPVSTVDTLGGASPFSSGFGSGKQIIYQGADATSNSVLSSYNPIFGPSSGSASSPTMASLLLNGSGTQVTSHFQTLPLPPFQNQLQINAEAMKMKVEGGQNRPQAWNNVPYQTSNEIDQVGLLSDPSVYWNSTTVNNAWHDPANVGSSSVPSLI